ncbi:superoxide dismutase family protein [Nesterenkonia sp. E16_7]|uniref:superoxide dismutase family protein n=1 Tax=unclassified Nesterenkonia TaxID=2629769 RepID=UPI001A921184|nr:MULTISPECIES: superoxide dismutase family protein [unclassified Nesterenkonia]MBO0595692.1 superoxide dismutase family protein [Nesterenkonia sp. E16_10]MBO0598501.1 superoxide dismutase family protein [Nesterenkonia sp. E16_7]
MSTRPHRSSARRVRGLPLSGIALAAALALAGCGGGDASEAEPDAEQNTAADPEDAQAGSEAEAGADGGAEAGDEVQDAELQGGPDGSEEPFASAALADVAGNDIGTVRFSEVANGVLIEAEVHDLDAGFRGITLHERGVCETQSSSESGVFGDFESSGGHLVGSMEEDMGIVDGEEAPQEEAPETDLDDLGEAAPPAEPEAVTHPDHAGDLPNLLVNQDRTGWLSLISDRLETEDLLGDQGSSVIIHAQPDNHGNVPERYFGPDAETLTSGDSGNRVACGVVEEQ